LWTWVGSVFATGWSKLTGKWGQLLFKQSWARKNIGEHVPTHEKPFGSGARPLIAYCPDCRTEEILGMPQCMIAWTISIPLVDIPHLAKVIAELHGQIAR
jgi:hypothetical protein